MPTLRVRGVSVETVTALHRRALAGGRSVEAEHRALLEEVLAPKVVPEAASDDDWWERARKMRESLAGRVFGDSTADIREDRDSR